MRKRLVRKTFDMIQDLSESENKEVGFELLYFFSLYVLNNYLHNTVVF